MSKRIAWLATASLAVLMSAAAGYWKYNDSHKAMFFQSGENEEQEQGRPPVDGDYWAIRVGYAGDPNNIHFEPRWLLAAAEQERHIASGVPSVVFARFVPCFDPSFGRLCFLRDCCRRRARCRQRMIRSRRSRAMRESSRD